MESPPQDLEWNYKYNNAISLVHERIPELKTDKEFSNYELFIVGNLIQLVGPGDSGLVMRAFKVSNFPRSEYLIFSELNSKPRYCGRIKSNITCSEYKLLFKRSDLLLETAVVNYNIGVFSSGCLTKLSLRISGLNKYSSTMEESVPVLLKNRIPVFDTNTNSYRLSFERRAIIPSTKNFIVCDLFNPMKPILQFGKLSETSYCVDFRHPISIFTAFSTVITMLDSKFK